LCVFFVFAYWTNSANFFVFMVMCSQEGVAGHGISSPFDIHNTLIVAGPDFLEHARSNLPTSNVDLAPTLLRLLGIPVAPSMTGRVIEEGLRATSRRLSKTERREVVRNGRWAIHADRPCVDRRRIALPRYTDVKRR
jgi:arylsulfatase A-like enzyme